MASISIETRRVDELANTIAGSGDDDLLIIRLADGTGTKSIKVADLRKILVGGHSGLATDDKTHSESIKSLDSRTEILAYTGAGLKNSIWRGKYLGNTFTAAQSATIRDGVFKDLWLGDYWTIGGVNYRIMHFDYWYRSGDNACMTHHVVLVPDTAFYDAQMNTTSVTTGGYSGSAMRASGLNSAKATIKNAFGSGHILSHRELLTNAISDGHSAGWLAFDADIEIMTERMVYGTNAWGNHLDAGNAPSQLAGFVARGDMRILPSSYWLRDVGSAVGFCIVGSHGYVGCAVTSMSYGVRPSFPIY